MQIELNHELKSPTMEILKKDFAQENIDWEKPLMFEYAPGIIQNDTENPPRKHIPSKPLMTSFSKIYNGKTTHFQYFESVFGPKDNRTYLPHVIDFDKAGQIIIDLSSTASPYNKNISKAFFLLHHPNRGSGHFVLRNTTKISQDLIQKSKIKTRALSLLNLEDMTGYIKDDELTSVAKRIGLQDASTYSTYELRDKLIQFAEREPEKFIEKLNDENVKTLELIQDALDYKVITYNRELKGYFYTMREGDEYFSKKMMDKAFYTVPVQDYIDPSASLNNFLTINSNFLLSLQELIEDEKKYLNLYPKKGNKTLADLAKQVVVIGR